jgi:hypothetical protein
MLGYMLCSAKDITQEIHVPLTTVVVFLVAQIMYFTGHA